jgi:putative DNA primase/helicase
MYNAESIVVDRKSGTPRTIFVPRAAVCVCGGIQPAVLDRALGTDHRESGLAARLLLACPPRRAKRWTEADIDPALEAALGRLLDRLYQLQPTVGDDGDARPALVRLTPEAKTAWVGYYNAHAGEQADLTGDMAAAWSKLEEVAARLALVMHLTRRAADDPTAADAGRADLTSMTAGITLAGWFKHEARRVYAQLGESETDRDQRRLVE